MVIMTKKQQRDPSFANLPLDFLIEVLVRFPAKFLMQYRCVCKSWNSLICDPQFAELHHAYSKIRCDGNCFSIFWHLNNRFGIYFVDHQGSTINHSMQFKSKYSRDHIIASQPLNGLVCLRSSLHHDNAMILNIATHQITPVPVTNFPVASICTMTYFLGCYTISPLKKEYKLLNFCRLHDDSTTCEIYTLGTDSRRIKIGAPEHIWKNSSSGHCVNGAIYWLSIREGNVSMISFDVCNEIFHETELSQHLPRLPDTGYNYNLFEVGGRLAITGYNARTKAANKIAVWFLEKGESKDWILDKKKIAFPRNLNAPDCHNLAGISEADELIVQDRLCSRNYYYNLKRKTGRLVSFCSYPSKNFKSCFLYSICHYHVENILRLKDPGVNQERFLIKTHA